PGGKCPFFKVIAAHRPVNADKHILRQVLGVIRGVREPIAQVVDPPVVQAHNLLPCHGIACQASANKCPCLLLFQAVSPSERIRSSPAFGSTVPTKAASARSICVSEKVYRKQG